MIAERLQEEIRRALRDVGFEVGEIVLEHPQDLSHGDYATNVALTLSKSVGKPPREIAEIVVAALKKESSDYIERIEVAGPGFINFHLSSTFYHEVLQEVLNAEAVWGRSRVLEDKQVLIEYTSPNLFKPLHIGNLIGNILGESLSRLLEFSGADVKRLNYPSDIGLTVAKGVWGLLETGGDPHSIGALGEAYRIGNSAYEENALAKEEIESINQALYEGSDQKLNELRRIGIETSRKHLAELCKVLGTTFDAEFFESESGKLGRELVRAHIEDGVFEKSDRAVIYRGEKDGLHTRVFLNSQELPTYEAKEVGLFDLKSRAYPDFDTSITVTGTEQIGFFQVVFAALRKVFSERIEGKELRHITNGFLRLTTGKMSSRKGNVITGESLLQDLKNDAYEKMRERELADTERISEQVAVAAIKYAVLKQGSGRDIVFDPDQSLSLEGDSGPYLQYAHTRALSVLEKGHTMGVSPQVARMLTDVTPVERLLYRFPEVVMRAQQEYEPHYLATYLIELAGAFNSWYAQEKIIDGSDMAPHKLAITKALAITLKNGLWLLGVHVPERM